MHIEAKHIIDFIEATEVPAIAAAKFLGRGENEKSVEAAFDAMSNILAISKSEVSVVACSGLDATDTLNNTIGLGETKIDVAISPLNGFSLCANNLGGVISALVATPGGQMMRDGGERVEKILTGLNLPDGVMIDVDCGIKENLNVLSFFLDKPIEDLRIAIFDDVKYKDDVEKLRGLGVSVQVVNDGAIGIMLETIYGRFDLYIATLGVAECIFAAALAQNFGGQLHARVLENEMSEKGCSNNIVDLPKRYDAKSIIGEETVFVATGISDSFLLDGIILDDLTHEITSDTIVITKKFTRAIKTSRRSKNNTKALRFS